MFSTNAKSTPEVTETERENRITAREAAREGIVLLKNNGTLPLSKGVRVALYGEGAVFTVKGGIGSGEVNCRHTVGIREGLEAAGVRITTGAWLDDYVKNFAEKRRAFDDDVRRRTGLMNFGALNYLLQHPFNNPEGQKITEEYLSDPQDVCIYVISRQAGENTDRKPVRGDFLLSEREEENLRICAGYYRHVILVINAGGSIDLSVIDEIPVDAVVFFGQQGQEGGHALADVLLGMVSPSGHLSFSWVNQYGDVPYGSDFSELNGNTEFEEYREGIYVGYRYFNTFRIPVRFPFGYGLSYASFFQSAEAEMEGSRVKVTVTVQNIGEYAGKAVAQIYASCPDGRLEKEQKRLVGFDKTHLLQPGKQQILHIEFPLRALASFDEESSAWILEPGDYVLLLGDDIEKTGPIAVLHLEKESTLSRHERICPVQNAFEELRQSAELRVKNTREKKLWAAQAAQHISIESASLADGEMDHDKPVWAESEEVEQLQAKLSDTEALEFLMGDGLDIALPKHHDFMVPGADAYTPARFEKRGIPSINFCDGPAGLRLFDVSVRTGNTVRMGRPVMESFARLPWIARKYMIRKPGKGRTLYQYATAFPSGMALGQSWSREIMAKVGHAVQKEMEAFGVEVWLAPGINLYRNPLCGRNYEYYSEDPVLSGSLAAALIRSVQDRPGFCATVKHFVCNNQEINRRYISEDVYPRALRELYLRNFEIAVKEGAPAAFMTSYNKVNGTYVAESRDLVTGIVRNEWHYEGLVMTDWTTDPILDAFRVIDAGVNMLMPGIRSDHKRLNQALRDGELSPEDMRASVSHVLDMVSRSRLYRR